MVIHGNEACEYASNCKQKFRMQMAIFAVHFTWRAVDELLMFIRKVFERQAETWSENSSGSRISQVIETDLWGYYEDAPQFLMYLGTTYELNVYCAYTHVHLYYDKFMVNKPTFFT